MAVPPAGTAVMDPSFPNLQEILTPLRSNGVDTFVKAAAGWVIVAFVVSVHPFASVTVNV